MSTIQNKKEAASTRNLGGKRCVRYSISINNEYNRKLSMLATSCGMTKSEMSDQLLRFALDSPSLIEWLQNKFNKVEQYRVKPLDINGKIVY